MNLIRRRGTTSNILNVFIKDSTSTGGAGLTGLAFNSAGLTAYFHRDIDAAPTAITLVTMTVGAFTSGGFVEIDAVNMPGWYQFCPPNTALAAAGTPNSVALHLKGATNMMPLPIEIQLNGVPIDWAGVENQDAAVYLEDTQISFVDEVSEVVNVQAIGPSPVNSIAVAVWNKTRAAHTIAGTFGEGVASVVGAVGSVTAGVALSATGLNAVAAPADLANDAAARATFVGMFRALFNRFYNDVRQTSSQQTVRSDAGAVVSTMAVSDDLTTQTKGKSA